MSKKTCFKCGIEKGIDDFYRHPQMSDGHVNKCKDCNKKDVKGNYDTNIVDPAFVEKERARGREKFHRLGYKEKSKIANESKPWLKESPIFNISRDLKAKGDYPDGTEFHHWNYNTEYLKDVIPLNRVIHRRIHKKLILDKELRIFKTLDGELLDTKEKHLNYIAPFLSEPIPASLQIN